MAETEPDWSPGSFTKNFSWGPASSGLLRLHETIRLGFNEQVADVPREEFRSRIAPLNRPDFIPMNFFLFNKIVNGVDYLLADELVFQAINFRHSNRFDKLALFAFNFSYAGTFKGARADQKRPALWAFHYIKDRIFGELDWDTSKFSADDIENFLSTKSNYKGQPSRRKAATNLAHLYRLGRLRELENNRVDRWWVDALFLALDRLIDNNNMHGNVIPIDQLPTVLRRSGFVELTGRNSLERQLGLDHLVRLYSACGGRERFFDYNVEAITRKILPDFIIPNDSRPQGAIHPTNSRILKSIPRVCAMLAKNAGFDILDADQLLNFDIDKFISQGSEDALKNLMSRGIGPTMTAAELLKFTREK